MAKRKCKTYKKGRIIYVEPNDVFGSINDVPLTPDYTDLCISFNLIVEVVSRYKQTAKQGDSNNGKYCIYWTSKLGLDQSKKWVSFLGGEELEKHEHYLTTYYTDTHYEDVLKKNIVEGLGIENITVAFENYYTPTVSIKFVDQRGSSLFGREEATHYNDQLTIDNIFGAFFTAPYPKFKLQIKGFYGKPVTLQLTCSGFKGSLNSKTGNFEATATFIGYSYSLLTDIPFQYIVAAPYCDYCGREYWNSKAHSVEWRTYKSNGNPMPTINEFVEKVNIALNDENMFNLLSDDDNAIIQSSETEKAELGTLYDRFARFIGDLSSLTEDRVIKNFVLGEQSLENEQMLLFTNSSEIKITDDVKKSFEDLIIQFNSYNETYSEHKIPTSSLPNEHSEHFPDLTCIELFEIEDTDSGIRIIRCLDENCSVINIDNLCNVEFERKNDNSGEYRKMERNTAKILVDYLNADVTNNIHRYACLVDLHNFRKRINDRLKEIDNSVTIIESQKERDYIELAQTKLTMVPYIGNIFKMIMAHIETLVYMMYKCFENIKADELKGHRSPEYLRVNIAKTDTIPTNRESVPAWPMVTKASSNNNENKSLEDENTLGWVGDFSPHFEEEKLVRALFLACKKTVKADINFEEHNSTVLYVPVLPNDISGIMNVFSASADKRNISYLAGMLGLRAAQLFGIMERSGVPSDIAECMGVMDAYNYYMMSQSKNELKEKIIDVAGDTPLYEKLYNIMLCKETEDNMGDGRSDGQIGVQPFETNKGIMSDVVTRKGRDPIFVENGNNLSYVHYYTKSRFGLVPSNIKEFTSYSTEFEYKGEAGNTYFDFNVSGNENYDILNNVLFNCNAKSLYKDKQYDERYKNLINEEKFKAESRPSTVNGILKRYEELKSQNFKLVGETFSEDFSKILNRYWDVEEKSFAEFYKVNGVMSKKLSDWEVKIKGDNNEMSFNSIEDYVKSFLVYDKTTFLDCVKAMPIVKKNKNESGWIVEGENISTDALCIPFLKLYNSKDKKNTPLALFGNSFYYLQNYLDADLAERCKATLFLHSMAQSLLGIKKIKSFDSDKTHGSIQAIPYALSLLYGALLWRHEYIVENGSDPILFEKKSGKSHYKYKRPSLANNNEATLFFKRDGKFRFGYSKTNDNFYDVHIKELFGGKLPDYYVSNELIRGFLDFVENEWKVIKKNCEIERSNSTDKKVTSKELEDIIYVAKQQAELDPNNYNNWFEEYNKTHIFKFIGFEDEKKKDAYNVFVYLNEDNENCQRVLRSLYCNKVIVLDVSNKLRDRESDENNPSNGTDVIVSSDTLRNYLKSFSETIKKIADKPSNIEISEDTDSGDPNDPDVAEFTRDVAIPIYMYLKMLWDKWLSGSDSESASEHEYTVGNFFKNFVFIDSFYRNIASRFMTNCQVFLEVYDGNTFCNQDSTVFKAIGDLTTRHHCLFLAIPDFIDNLASEKPTEAVEALESMFVPMPYDEMPPIQLNNRFVVIYVPKLSETPSELNNYKEDGFNIWSYNDSKYMADPNLPQEWIDLDENDNDLPPILKKNTGDSSTNEDATRYGYFVPSFGLAYGYQHNHLFKDVNLNMETPVITSAVINTLSHIAKQGSGNEHKVAFIGQDLYPVFSNYSYICEFEMMGCAQVQPLMYFQLMNVPMWRGTYMIFNVTHTMTPGNMVTKVKAMKLSNRAVPYSNAWFTKNMAYKGNKNNGTGDDCEEEGTYNLNTSSDGTTSYDYSKYKHLVNKNDRSKYIDMDKVLEGVATIEPNSDCGGTSKHRPHKMTPIYTINRESHGKCTSGPITWYKRGSNGKIILNFWKNGGPHSSGVYCDLSEFGFLLVHQSGRIDSKSNKKDEMDKHGKWSGLEPGDVMVIFGYYPPSSGSGITAHAAMWTGKDWRSDFIQSHAGVEYGLRTPSDGKGSIQIWRFSDKKYEETHPNAKPIN